MTPEKPFSTYKWRWLSVQPSESLLQAPIFLGVLRALARNEGEAYSSTRLQRDLRVVQQQTHSPVTLARDRERNLFRNSGQYWRGTGLVTDERGLVQLTGLGRSIAAGQVTQAEFAALMVQETELPNPATYSVAEMARWRAAGLSIKPLKLILEVLEELGRRHGGLPAAYLTNNELVDLVIPLAGILSPVSEIARNLALHRRGRLNIAGWPDCAPASNDKRLAHEFLLFLANFGLLRLGHTDGLRDDQRYHLAELFDVDLVAAPIVSTIFGGDVAAQQAVREIRHSDLPSIIERQRRLASVLSRPNQARFRSAILNAAQGRCFLSGESIPGILEAAHIVPAAHGGADEEANGLCLRVDLHRLFDSGNLLLRPDGTLVRSEALTASPNYAFLPDRVEFPTFVNNANVAWRSSYL